MLFFFTTIGVPRDVFHLVVICTLLILLQHLQRHDIVNGVVKVDGVTNDVTIDQEDKIEVKNVYHPILFLLRMEALHALTFCCIFL